MLFPHLKRISFVAAYPKMPVSVAVTRRGGSMYGSELLRGTTFPKDRGLCLLARAAPNLRTISLRYPRIKWSDRCPIRGVRATIPSINAYPHYRVPPRVLARAPALWPHLTSVVVVDSVPLHEYARVRKAARRRGRDSDCSVASDVGGGTAPAPLINDVPSSASAPVTDGSLGSGAREGGGAAQLHGHANHEQTTSASAAPAPAAAAASRAAAQSGGTAPTAHRRTGSNSSKASRRVRVLQEYMNDYRRQHGLPVEGEADLDELGDDEDGTAGESGRADDGRGGGGGSSSGGGGGGDTRQAYKSGDDEADELESEEEDGATEDEGEGEPGSGRERSQRARWVLVQCDMLVVESEHNVACGGGGGGGGGGGSNGGNGSNAVPATSSGQLAAQTDDEGPDSNEQTLPFMQWGTPEEETQPAAGDGVSRGKERLLPQHVYGSQASTGSPAKHDGVWAGGTRTLRCARFRRVQR